jgi:hypothetical protein
MVRRNVPQASFERSSAMHASSSLLRLVLAAGMAATFARTAAAQTTTGFIDGLIRDPNGGVLPGVQVVANSPALIQKDLTVYSDEKGYYRIQTLPPGVYSVSFLLAGFQTLQRVGLIVNAGQTTSVDVQLPLATLEQSVTVSGQSPTIDSSSAKVGFTYSRALVENIPTRRDFNALAATIPGVESANNFGPTQPGDNEFQNVLGAGSRANFFRFDGVAANDPSTGANQTKLFSYDIIEEVHVLKGGKPAEVGFAQGGWFQIVTKSGGNTLHGVGALYVEDDSLEGNNVDERLTAAGVTTSNRLRYKLDASATGGGPILRDLLWWFGSVRRDRQSLHLLGIQEPLEDRVHAYFWKNTWQPNAGHRLTGVANRWAELVNYYFFGFSPTLAAGADVSKIRDTTGSQVSLQWNGTFGPRLVADAAFGYSVLRNDQLFQPNAGVPIRDTITGIRYQNPGQFQRLLPGTNFDYNASLSWFRPTGAGRHDAKTGWEFTRGAIRGDFDEIHDQQLLVANLVPSRVMIFNTPVSVAGNIDTSSLFAQDAWTIGNHLTLNLGVRFDRTNAYTLDAPVGGGDFAETPLADLYPELKVHTVNGEHLLTWNNLAPRVAASWSLGPRTSFKASGSRYYHYLQGQHLPAANLASILRLTFIWDDVNKDGAYQLGEERRLVGRTGGTSNSIDPDIRHPYSDEAIVGVSRELFADFSINASFIYRQDHDLTNFVDVGVPFSAYSPVEVVDPGEDGVRGTSDDQPLTVFAEDNTFLGENVRVLTNPPGNTRTYRGLEVTANKRLSHRYQFVGSLVISRMEVTEETNDTGQTDRFTSPNDLLNARGRDTLNRAVQVKLQGTYEAPRGVYVSAFYRFASGLPFTRTLAVSGLPQGVVTVFAEPRGSRVTDAASNLDFRIEKSFKAGGDRRVGLMLDVFNVFNASTIVQLGSTTGVNLGRPQSVVNPRLARFGVRFIW